MDVLKHLAIFSHRNNPDKYGIAFAVNKDNHNMFLAVHGKSDSNVIMYPIKKSEMVFIHYSMWLVLLDEIPFLIAAMSVAKSTKPSNYPEPYAPCLFEGECNTSVPP